MSYRRLLCVAACLAPLPLAGSLPDRAAGCAGCYSFAANPFALPHPRAIEVALAAREAVEQGVLDGRAFVREATAFGSGGGLVALRKVSGPALVRAWAGRLDPAPCDRPMTVHFLFVDTGEACGLEFRGGAVLFQASPSAHSDASVVTTRPALHGLIAGRVSLAAAVNTDLLLLEGDRASAAAALGGAAARGGEARAGR